MDDKRPDGETVDRLFSEFKKRPTRKVRNQLVEAHAGLAVFIAKKYANRGVSLDDLRQVAMLALVKAMDRFDMDRGIAFSTFATRTIDGEIKHHFRDHTWAVRVPRSLKDRHLQVRRATQDMQQDLGRSPTVRELASYLGCSPDDVVDAMSANTAYNADSVDLPATGDSDTPKSALLADLERGFRGVENHLVLQQSLARLDARSQQIVKLRFVDEMTQSEIAEAMSMSQMHVSRLLRRSLQQLRDQVVESGAE